MENVGVVKNFKSLDDLDEDSPDILFSQVSLFLLVSRDLLEQIPVVCVLHDNTKLINGQNQNHVSVTRK